MPLSSYGARRPGYKPQDLGDDEEWVFYGAHSEEAPDSLDMGWRVGRLLPSSKIDPEHSQFFLDPKDALTYINHKLGGPLARLHRKYLRTYKLLQEQATEMEKKPT